MLSLTASLLLIGGFFQGVVSTARILPRDGRFPALPYADDTTKYCVWWLDYESVGSCVDMLEANYINLEEFRRWNPSVNADCGNLVVGKSYCVETADEPAASDPAPAPAPAPASSSTSSVQSSAVPTPSTFTTSSQPVITSSASKSTPPLTTTTTSAGNGVETPQPTQPGMVSNCNKFHYIGPNTVCSQVLSYQKISMEDLYRWNPSVNADCTGLQKLVNVCVGVIGGSTPTPTPTPTATKGNNGVETPLPTQPGIVSNCAVFHYIGPNTVCSQVLSYQKISMEDLYRWNPSVNADCTGLQKLVNVCVRVIGATTTTPKPSTTTTTPGNGIQTPQPTQPGMVTNCNKFHFINQGVVCSQVISYQKITREDFVKWNPTVNDDCSGMWANVNVCVGVIGGVSSPTPTTSAANPIQTPQPTQPGMVSNCKKFHYAAQGVVCSQLTSYNKISLADFVKWNPGVGSDCRTMWANTYFCVGV